MHTTALPVVWRSVTGKFASILLLPLTTGAVIVYRFFRSMVEITESLSLFWAPPRYRQKAFWARSLSIVLRICSSTSLGSVTGGVGSFLRTGTDLSTIDSGVCKPTYRGQVRRRGEIARHHADLPSKGQKGIKSGYYQTSNIKKE